MPDRNQEGAYRYAYQGQEKDAETGMEAFELRLWDARIGRWLTTDPYGQYNSPYLGMGNNPISSIDADGGWETKWGRFWGWVGNGFQGKFTNNENVTGANKYGISFDYGGGPGEGELTGSYTANSRSGLDSWNSNQEWGNWRFTENGQGFEAAMMQGSNLNWGDRWSQGNFAKQAVYHTANSFSIVGQSMNPFDNQVTSISGEGLNGTDRSIYGAEVAAALIPIQGGSVAAGPLKQWIRFGPSYSKNLSVKTAYSIKWGASPSNGGKFLKQIPSKTFRNINQRFRNLKLPGNSPRTIDPGHYHIKF